MNTNTGNRVVLKIKGTTIGMAQNCSFDDDSGLQEVSGFGDVEVVEYVVGKLSHRINGEKYFVNSDTLKSLGMVPGADEWLTAPELTVEVVDKLGGTLELYTGCKFATHSRRYTKHAVTGENFSIQARHKST